MVDVAPLGQCIRDIRANLELGSSNERYADGVGQAGMLLNFMPI